MRILADENVEQQIVERLRADGHVVEYVVEEPSTRGSSDIPILRRAARDNILLVTGDLDFGGYIYRDNEAAPDAGVVQYRLDPAMLPEQKYESLGMCLLRMTHTSLLTTSRQSRRAQSANVPCQSVPRDAPAVL